jgi:hypothetical protein
MGRIREKGKNVIASKIDILHNYLITIGSMMNQDNHTINGDQIYLFYDFLWSEVGQNE